MLGRSNYYNFEFSDSDKFLAFEAELPGESEVLWLYARRESSDASRMMRALHDQKVCPMTLALRVIGESGKHRQYLITRVLSTRLVLPDE